LGIAADIAALKKRGSLNTITKNNNIQHEQTSI